MRKLIIVPTLATLVSLIAVTAVKAQSGSYFNAVTNLNPVIYLPLTETAQPTAVPVAANSGTLGATDNGTYTKGAVPGAPGALSLGADVDTAGLFSGVSDAGMFANYDGAYGGDTNFTIELWVNSAVTDPGELCVASCVDAASPRHGWIIYEDATTDGTFNFRTYGTNGTTPSDTSSGYNMEVPGGHIVAGTWYHVVVTFDGTNIQGYINGQPSTNTSTASVYVGSTAGAFSVGARSDNSFNFDGLVDEVSLYSNVLSAVDIANHYAAGASNGGYSAAVLADNPQLYFRLDDAPLPPVAQNYGSAGALGQGIYQAGTTPGVPGPNLPGMGGANSFAVQFPSGSASDNGSTVLVQGASGLSVGNATPITLAMWAQAANGNTTPGFETMIGRGDQSYRFDLDPTHPHWNAGNINEITGSDVLNDGNWHFWAGTWDGSNISALYIDGVLVGESTGNTGPNGTQHTFDIGDAPDYTGRNFGGGAICQVAVFPMALTPSQIQNLYFAAGTPPVFASQPVDSVAFVGSNITFSVSALGDQPLTYQWYGPEASGVTPPAAAIAGATNSTLTISGADSSSAGNYFVVVTDANGLSTTSGTSPNGTTTAGAILNVITNPYPSSSYFTAVVNLNPLGYWPLNETNAAPAWPAYATNIGTLGAAGNAIYSGLIAYQNPSGLVSDSDGSISGDGTETQVVLPYQSALATVPLTLEGWFSPAEGFNNGGETLMSDGQPAGNNTGFWINAGFHTVNGQGDFNLLSFYGNGGSSGVNIDVTNISPNQWYHVAVTIAPNPGSNSIATGYLTTFYVNGTNAGSEVSAFIPNADAQFKIGNRSDDPGYGSYNFLGGMDEVAFYPTALSAATIAAHYAAGTNPVPATPYMTLVLNDNPLLYYRLDESQPTFPDQDTGPVAVNYGATGTIDNGVYLAGTFPGSVVGPKVHGFPGDNVGVGFEHIYWLAGGPTSAGNFNGGSLGNTGLTGYVDVPLDGFNSLDYQGPVTLAAWLLATPNDGGRFETFVGRGDPSYRMDVDGTSSDQLHFAYGGSADQNGIAPAGDANDNNWHFVVGTWDGTTQTLYVDGLSNSASIDTAHPTGDAYDFTIGEAPDDSGRLFDGGLAEIAIFPYALSAAQVEALYVAAGASVFISEQPPATQTVGAGTTVTISAIAGGGNPSVGYQWLVGGVPVSGAEYSGATTGTLTITDAQVPDSGNYSVVATNIGSTVTSAVSVLNVVQSPILSPQLPATTYTLAGNEVSLSVGLISQSPTTNAWYFNGVLLTDGGGISGATTSTLTILSAQTANVGTYMFTTTNAFGNANTSGTLSVLPITEPTFDTNGTYWTMNNNGVSATQGSFVTNDVIELTDGKGSEVTSFFFDVPMYIRAFNASFVYEDVGSDGVVNDTADGFTFTIQNNGAGASAIETGGGGSGLGYYQLTNSAALAAELYDNNGDNAPGIAYVTNGQPSIGVAPGGYVYGSTGDTLSIISGDPILFNLSYDGNKLSVTLTDTLSTVTYSTNYDVGPLWETVGGNTAFVGFTAATGGVSATQTISNFVFTPLPALSASTSAGNLTLTWPTGMGLGPYSLQQTASLSSPSWTTAAGSVSVVNNQYQVTIPVPSGPELFYRLVATP